MSLDLAVFYFSGTGNTWWVARTLAAELREAVMGVAVHSIEAVTPEEADRIIASVQIVAFAYPIYGSDLPLPMKRFIKALAPVQDKRALVLCTQWLWSGDGARVAGEFTREKGFDIRWAEHLHMPNNLSVAFPIPIHTDDQRRKEKYLRHTVSRLRRLVHKVRNDIPFRRGFSFISVLSGLLQRVPYRAMMENGGAISVDRQKCTLCGECLTVCPVDNIGMGAEGVVMEERCVNCMRCYNFCPVTAFRFRGKSHRHGPPYRGPVPGFDPRIMKEKRET